MDQSIDQEYKKKCPNCKRDFTANHLNRKYCSERCKRQMFLRNKRSAREIDKKEKDLFLKNNRILKDLYEKGKTKVSLTRLKDLGFDELYFHAAITHMNDYLIIYDDFHLEVKSENSFIIHHN